ncbi:histidine ammonia-lyase [Microbacterium sp. VKM Ac-2870]|uniref:histidine ammonia-lyase n=1 Tax=Microbacterium sp. VKM Ac-2870 TaxID=2783825 RepID=UPI00188A93B8|nr:histidine ammonia-lyase [Microbacterium sp. VKM Ac-2870]MBF4562516.1 histidine ammonia-lyase [Microbacterium sp. VKM Ac-2870]
MGVAFPTGTVSLTTAEGDIVLLRICELCGAAVVDADDTDLAFHKRWHRMTGSGNWVDPATGRPHGPGAPGFGGGSPS